MILGVPTRGHVEEVRHWRNDEPQFLRTPYLLTEEMQGKFYEDVICNRDSKHRYFAVMYGVDLAGFGGLTNIEWENGCAEISLIINPEYRGQGYGREAVNLLLDHGFDSMRLETIYGEVYYCGNVGFWEKLVDEMKGHKTRLVGRKFYEGVLYDSMWFAFRRPQWFA